MKFLKEFTDTKNAILAAQKIAVISHKHPDGDTIGANLALTKAIKEQWGKSVTIACIDPVPENSTFLFGAKDYVRDFNPDEFDLFIAIDCGAYYMTKFHEKYPEIFKKTKPLINIDHHTSNDFFGTINIIDTEAASATHIIYYFLKLCGFLIDRHIATCLLHGLYFDTGSFMHSNVTPEVLRVASDLLFKGADFKTIAKKQFRTSPVSQLRLWGRIFNRIHVTPKKLTRSFIMKRDFEETGASHDDTTGAIDYLNSIPDGKFCALITEDKGNLLKGSFRTRTDDLDLAKLALIFGGGGHKKAAGFSMPAKIDIKDDLTRLNIRL